MIINLPKLGPVKFRDDLTPEQFQAQLEQLQQKYDFKLPKPEVGMGTLLKRGFMRGLGETGIALGDVLPAMGASALGFEDYAKRQMEEAATSRAELEKQYPTQFKSYTEVSSPYEALQFGAETLGELGPTALTSLIPGVGAGAVGSRLAGQAALRSAMAAGPVSRAGLAAVEKAAETAGRRAMYGGVYFGSFAQNAPEVFENIYQETNKLEPGVAALAGGISSVLDSIVPGQLLDKFGAYGRLKMVENVAKQSGAAPKVWKAIGKEAAKSAAAEGLTESVQEAISAAAAEVAGSAKSVFDPENIQQYKEAFVKGAIGGGAFGTVGGVRRGLVERGEYRAQEEAKAEEQARVDAEAAALRLQQEEAAQAEATAKRAASDEAARQVELQALQARMDEQRPGSQAYADLEAQIKKAQAEAEKARAKLAEEDAKKAEGSAFAKAEPTPGTGGMFKPALEQQRIGQQMGMRSFAFGDVGATQAPADPVTPDTLQTLKIGERSKMGLKLLGIDLGSVEGRRRFIQTLEDPSYTGNIDPVAYDDIISTFDPKEVAAARAEMQIEPTSPTKQKQQQQTRAFAFGDRDVAETVGQTGGAGPSVSGEPAAGVPAGATEQTEPSGVVPAGTTAEQPAGRAEQQPAPVNAYEQGVADAKSNWGLNTNPHKKGTPEHQQWADGWLDTKYPDSRPKTTGEPTSGTQAPQAVQAEAQGQEAPAARGVGGRPSFPTDLETVKQKLGARGAKLDQQAKDAKAYFGKVVPELALDSIANDVVNQPTAYRNAKMKMPSATEKGKMAATPEPLFGTEAEAGFFKGQGGVHAKNAEAWARANLSPEAVAYLDKQIALYQKERDRSKSQTKRAEKQQQVRKAGEQQLREERKAAQRPSLRKAVSDMYFGETFEDDLQGLSRSDKLDLLADEDLAALQTSAHPAILHQLARGDLVGALEGLSDSASSEIASKIATLLMRVVGNVKVVYAADRSRYDPNTNTIYLREGASEYEILHEAAHAAMSHVLANPSHPVTRQITTLFNQLKSSLEGAYGAQDIQEFTAEAWSNSEFRDHLKTFKPDGQKFTGWERFVNAVRQLLGMQPKYENAYDKLDRMLNEIISPPPETRNGDSLYAQSLGVPNFALSAYKATDKTLSKIPTMTPERRTKVWSTLEQLTLPARGLFYKTLNMSAMGQVGTKYFGDLSTRLSDLVNEMGGYQEMLLEAMQPLHQRLTDFRATGGARYTEFSKLINDSTIPDIRPYPESESMYRNTGKYAEYIALRNRFNKLTPDEQKLYREYFATFKTLDKEFEKSLKGNLEGAVDDREKALSAYDKIMQELAALRIDHYAPLFREGQYWLAYDMNGQPVRRLFATQVERAAARREVEGQGAANIEEYSRAEQISYRNVPDGTMLSSIMKIMKDAGAGEDDINRLIQLVVQAMPETSILKSRQKRSGVAGYIDDNAAYVFDRVTSNTARQIARMRYGQQMKRVIAGMEEEQGKLRGEDSADAKMMLDDFVKRYDFAMDPNLSNYAQWASTGAFYFNLAGNISSALVNVLQTPMVALPQMGGRYGFANTTRALNNARKLYMSSSFRRQVQELTGGTSTQRAMYSVENLVSNGKAPQYKGLIEALKGHGLLTTSTARDAINSENQNASGYGGANKLQRITTLVGTFMFHHAERMNREVTAVAAFDLEMQRLRNSRMSPQEREAAAIREAIRMVEYAHGAGSTLAGPSLGQSDIGKILMVFKRFAFSMYYMLFDTMRRSLPLPPNATPEQKEGVRAARRQLAGIYGMAALFAGAKGIPLYWVAEMAYNMFQDDDDEDFDALMRRYLGEFAFKGPINYFTNLSIADRVGWTDLIFRENKGDRADASAVTTFLEGVLGAPYSIVLNAEKGMKLVAEGEFYRGIEAMLPAVIKNILKGNRYANEGANTLRGDPVMGDINGYNAMMQVLGFAPADLMKQYDENAYIKQREGAITKKEKSLLKQYYVAMREGDFDRMMNAQEKLFELGAKYPELGISGETLSKSVEARDRISAKMFHGVQLNDKLRARLEGAASTVYD